MKQGYKTVVKQKEYMKYLMASIINRCGDSIDMIAFSWLIYEVTGSASWSTIILGMNMLPTVLIQPLAGAIVEGLNKKKVMVICDCLRGFFVALIASLFLMERLNPWILLIITLANSSVEAFGMPAGMAFLPKLLSKEDYNFGISLSQSTSRLMEVVGMGVAGIIISTLGIGIAIYIDAISFFLSGLIIAFIKVKESIKERPKFEIKAYFDILSGGFTYVRSIPIVLCLCLFGMLLNVLLVPFSALQTPYVKDILGIGASGLSMIGISGSIGLALGAFVYPYLNQKFTHRTLFLTGGFFSVLLYLGWYLIPLIDNKSLILIVLGIITLIAQFGLSFLISSVNISFIQHVEEDYLARAGSIFNSIACFASPATSFLLSGVLLFLSIREVFIFFALFTFILFTVMIFIKTLKEM